MYLSIKKCMRIINSKFRMRITSAEGGTVMIREGISTAFIKFNT